MTLASWEVRAADLVAAARRDGVTIDDGNVVDLLADNFDALRLDECRALAAGMGFDVYPAPSEARGTRRVVAAVDSFLKGRRDR